MNPTDLALLSGLTAVIVQIDKRFGVHLTARLPAGWRWVPVALIAALLAVSEGIGAGAPWQTMVFNAVGAAVGAMGVDAGLTESPLPWSGGAGGKTKNG